jgi:hypothetical protein
MSTPSLAHDLALKRTVHAPVEQKPHYAWRDVLAGEDIPARRSSCSARTARSASSWPRSPTRSARPDQRLPGPGDKEIFTEPTAPGSRICRELAGNLEELAREQHPLRLTLNALYELIEKTLVDNNAYMWPRACSSTAPASFPSTASGAQTRSRHPPQQPVVPWNEQKVEIAIRKTFLSLAAGLGPGGGDHPGRGRPGARLEAGLRPHRGDTGHGAGGADEGRPLQGGRGLHSVPGRARRRPRERVGPGACGAGDDRPGQETLVVVKKANGENILWDGSRPAQADRVRPHRPRPVPDQRADRAGAAPGGLRPDLRRRTSIRPSSSIRRP